MQNNGVLFQAKQTSGTMYESFFIAILFGIIGLAITIMGLVIKSFILYLGLVLVVVAVVCAIRGFIIFVKVSHNTLEFYDGYYVIKSGVLSKNESKVPVLNVLSVSLKQSIGGRIFNYGNVKVNFVGKGDLNLGSVKNPKALIDYINSLINNTNYDNLKQTVID